jgi:N utilization substance protein A
MATELMRIIEQVSRQRGVDKSVLIKAIEDAVKVAVRKRFGPDRDIEVNFNEELGEVEIFEFKEVVENVTDPQRQISLKEALELDPEVQVGDSLGVKMDTNTLGRIAAQAAKQVIMQRFREAERDIIYDDFKDRKGEIVNGIVQRIERGSIIVNLGRTEAELPPEEQMPNESYKQGDRIRGYIIEVKHYSRGPQIILSRTHPDFVKALFENEVPEISEGIVEIVQVAREPGSRTKIAVRSKDPDVDPVGACVGLKGRRVQAVVQELRGEKIDIVPWSPDPAKFVCNALAPAEIVRVIVDEANKSMEVVVPDDQLSLAIGKKGQNVRLAAKLTGWNLDVISESRYNQALKKGFESLLSLEHVDLKLATDLYDKGYGSAFELANADEESLLKIEGMTPEKARLIIEEAKEYVAKKEQEASESEGQEKAVQ